MDEQRSPVTLELRAEVIWTHGADGPTVQRIEVRDCILIAPAAAELLALYRAEPPSGSLH